MTEKWKIESRWIKKQKKGRWKDSEEDDGETTKEVDRGKNETKNKGRDKKREKSTARIMSGVAENRTEIEDGKMESGWKNCRKRRNGKRRW